MGGALACAGVDAELIPSVPFLNAWRELERLVAAMAAPRQAGELIA